MTERYQNAAQFKNNDWYQDRSCTVCRQMGAGGTVEEGWCVLFTMWGYVGSIEGVYEKDVGSKQRLLNYITQISCYLDKVAWKIRWCKDHCRSLTGRRLSLIIFTQSTICR